MTDGIRIKSSAKSNGPAELRQSIPTPVGERTTGFNVPDELAFSCSASVVSISSARSRRRSRSHSVSSSRRISPTVVPSLSPETETSVDGLKKKFVFSNQTRNRRSSIISTNRSSRSGEMMFPNPLNASGMGIRQLASGARTPQPRSPNHRGASTPPQAQEEAFTPRSLTRALKHVNSFKTLGSNRRRSMTELSVGTRSIFELPASGGGGPDSVIGHLCPFRTPSPNWNAEREPSPRSINRVTNNVASDLPRPGHPCHPGHPGLLLPLARNWKMHSEFQGRASDALSLASGTPFREETVHSSVRVNNSLIHSTIRTAPARMEASVGTSDAGINELTSFTPGGCGDSEEDLPSDPDELLYLLWERGGGKAGAVGDSSRLDQSYYDIAGSGRRDTQSGQTFVRLLYVSVAGAELAKARALKQLAALWSVTNQRLGVSSFLVWLKPFIFQVLEGPEDSLRLLTQKIRTDNRHGCFSVLKLSEAAPLYQQTALEVFDASKPFRELAPVFTCLRNCIPPEVMKYGGGDSGPLQLEDDDDDDMSGGHSPLLLTAEQIQLDAQFETELAERLAVQGDPRLTELRRRAALMHVIQKWFRPIFAVYVTYLVISVPVLIGLDRPVSSQYAVAHGVFILLWGFEIAMRMVCPKEVLGVLDTDGDGWSQYMHKTILWDMCAAVPCVFIGLAGFEGMGLDEAGGVHPLWLTNQLMVGRYCDEVLTWIFNRINVLPRTIRILKCFFLFTVTCHIMTCLWLMLLFREPREDSIAWHGLRDIYEQPMHEQYLLAFDQTVKLMSGMAKAGRSMPHSELQTYFCLFLSFIGVGLYATVIATIGSLVTEKVTEEEILSEQLDHVLDVFHYYKMPRDFVAECKGYMQHVAKHKRILVPVIDVIGDLDTSIALRIETLVGGDSIKKLPWFKEAAEADQGFLHFMLAGLKPQSFCRGEVAMQRGEEGDEMFFIVNGELEVLGAGQQRIAMLHAGDFFGEIALFHSCRRTATVTANTYSSCFRLGRDVFEEAEMLFPVAIQKVRASSQQRLMAIKLAAIVEKTPLFREFSSRLVEAIVSKAEPRVFPPGSVIVEAGEVWSEMWFVAHGKVVMVADGQTWDVLEPGDYFGEIGLLYSVRNPAAVIAERYSDLFSFSRADFEAVQRALPEDSKQLQQLARDSFQAQVLGDVMENIALFHPSTISAECRHSITALLTPIRVPAGETVFVSGDRAEHMYIVLGGKLHHSIEDMHITEYIGGSYFGEESLFDSKPDRIGSVLAVHDSELVSLNASDFQAHIEEEFDFDVRSMQSIAEGRRHRARILQVMLKLPIFVPLRTQTAVLQRVMQQMRQNHYGNDDTIVRRGDWSRDMVIIVSGTVRKMDKTQVARSMVAQPGSVHGEQSLFWRLTRAFSLRATSNVTSVSLSAS
eukprot:Hpha_TRINITY_DN22244_c0_g1::TRINITY_DN22244_c0_g1_i1::g.167289::m.167289